MSTALPSEPQFQVDDRIQLRADVSALQQGLFPLEPVLVGYLSQAQVVVDVNGESTVLKLDAARGAFQSVKHLRPLAKTPAPLVLECINTSPLQCRLRVEPLGLPSAPNDVITFNPGDARLLTSAASARWRDFRLSLQATRLAMVAGFDQELAGCFALS